MSGIYLISIFNERPNNIKELRNNPDAIKYLLCHLYSVNEILENNCFLINLDSRCTLV